MNIKIKNTLDKLLNGHKLNKDTPGKRAVTKLSADEILELTSKEYEKACSQKKGFIDKSYDQGYIDSLNEVIRKNHIHLSSDEWFQLYLQADYHLKEDVSSIERCNITNYMLESKNNTEHESKNNYENKLREKYVKEINKGKKSSIPTEVMISLTTLGMIDKIVSDENDYEFGDKYIDTLSSIAKENGMSDRDIDWGLVNSYALTHGSPSYLPSEETTVQYYSKWLDVVTKASLKEQETNVEDLRRSLDQLDNALLGRHSNMSAMEIDRMLNDFDKQENNKSNNKTTKY